MFVPSSNGNGGRYCNIVGPEGYQNLGDFEPTNYSDAFRRVDHTVDGFRACGGAGENRVSGGNAEGCIKLNPTTGLWEKDASMALEVGIVISNLQYGYHLSLNLLCF